jgi:hypothetical protein
MPPDRERRPGGEGRRPKSSTHELGNEDSRVEAPTVTVQAVVRTTAEAIEGAHRLGHISDDDVVVDTTYGRGRFWTRWRPARLLAFDRNERQGLTGRADLRALPLADASVDVVAIDPPFKLDGTSALGDFDDAYGLTGGYVPRAARSALYVAGIADARRMLRTGGRLLVKAQNQTSSGALRWQYDDVVGAAVDLGFVRVDEFYINGARRRQPMDGRRQVHAHGRPSMLGVFWKAAS